jgi:hypothetical protein
MIDDQLLSTLAGIRVESAFGPFPSIDVRRMTLDGCDLAIIVVHPASSPPVLGLLKWYGSLMPMAQEVRKPIFHLRPADGALGAHANAAREALKFQGGGRQDRS